MITELKKLLTFNRPDPIQSFAATPNDTIYATPRDFMKIILNEYGIRGQVAMCFLDDRSLVLLVRTRTHLSYALTMELKERLLSRIERVGGNCRIPREIFWSLGAPEGQ